MYCVTPIFQTFGDQSQFLGFQWCEVPTKEHVGLAIDPDTRVQTTPIKYYVGVGTTYSILTTPYHFNVFESLFCCVIFPAVLLDPDNIGSYIKTEMRSVDISLTFNNCHLWMQDFELVAYLSASLQEQQVILKKQNKKDMKEISGVIEI
ncbi:hypothetical protein CLU79DRAFT_852746 [Phycomyces nitens]|nr:hypothetical protein CLU79DRAFT_852746 [Phycomyces nitens]